MEACPLTRIISIKILIAILLHTITTYVLQLPNRKHLISCTLIHYTAHGCRTITQPFNVDLLIGRENHHVEAYGVAWYLPYTDFVVVGPCRVACVKEDIHALCIELDNAKSGYSCDG